MIWIVFLSLLFWAFLFIAIHIQLPIDKHTVIEDTKPAEVTVMIAMRDEVTRITETLASLNDSVGLQTPIEVIIIDDHSSDGSTEVVETVKSEMSNLLVRVMASEGKGKKEALKTGLKQVKPDLLYLTDADISVGKDTISSLVKELDASIQTGTVFGPVLYTGNSLFENMLVIENVNNQSVSAALLENENPLMVNAANMLVARKHIEAYKESLNSDFASGDDVLFALNLPVSSWSFVFNTSSAVFTNAPSGVMDLWNQRLRWLSKRSAYKVGWRTHLDKLVFGLACLHVFATGSLILSNNYYWLLIYLISRWLIEYAFLSSWAFGYSKHISFVASLGLSLFYPFYVLLIGIASLLKLNFQWKGRTYSE